jgi:hypothetical protein
LSERIVVAVLVAATMVTPAKAEVDWATDFQLPNHDVALGLSMGAAFSEAGTRASGILGGFDISYYHGFLGLHLNGWAHPEGPGIRLGGGFEGSFWYVAMAGLGIRVGTLLGGDVLGSSQHTVAITTLLGLPLPLVSLSEGKGGTLVLMPFIRPGLRLVGGGNITGHHQAGVTLTWTSYGF